MPRVVVNFKMASSSTRQRASDTREDEAEMLNDSRRDDASDTDSDVNGMLSSEEFDSDEELLRLQSLNEE